MIDYSNINQTRHLIIVNKSLKQKKFLYDKPWIGLNNIRIGNDLPIILIGGLM